MIVQDSKMRLGSADFAPDFTREKPARPYGRRDSSSLIEDVSRSRLGLHGQRLSLGGPNNVSE